MLYLNLFYLWIRSQVRIQFVPAFTPSFMMEAGDNIIRMLLLSEYAHQHIDSVHMCKML